MEDSTTEPARLDLPMHGIWRFAVVVFALGAAVAAALCALELAGIVGRDSLLRGASDGERWLGTGIGLLAQPFSWSLLRHGRLRIDAAGMQHLGLGVLCSSRTVEFADVRRWGTAVATNRGRRERHVLFEMRDGTRHSVKVAMYRDVQRALDVLTHLLGVPSPAYPTLGGIRFEAPD